jgi:hypothetical protein
VSSTISGEKRARFEASIERRELGLDRPSSLDATSVTAVTGHLLGPDRADVHPELRIPFCVYHGDGSTSCKNRPLVRGVAEL